MSNLDFSEIIRAVVILTVLTVVALIAYFGKSEAAIGALIGLLGVAGGYFFHSKVQTINPDGSSTTVTPTLH